MHAATSSVSGLAQEPVAIPEIPVLVPGQEWRTWWDMTSARTDSKDRHDVVTRYEDTQGQPLETRCVLDWSSTLDRHAIRINGIHEVAEHLESIQESLTAMMEPGVLRGLAVYTRNGDAKDESAPRKHASLPRINQARPHDPRMSRRTRRGARCGCRPGG